MAGFCPPELEQNGSEMLGSCSHHYLPHSYASREKYEIKRKRQEIRDYVLSTHNGGQ